MEKQRVSLLKMKNHWGLTALSVMLCLVLSPVLWMTLFIPQVMTILPVLLLLLLGFVGPVSAAACSAVLITLCSMLFGIWGGLAAALFFVPVVVVCAYTMEQEYEFWPSVAAGSVTMFASMGLMLGLLTLLAGSDIVTAISSVMRQALETSGALGDSLLAMLAQTGLITLADGSAVTVAALDAAAREELLSALILMMDSVLRLEIPMQMATGSVAAGLLGQAVLRRGMLSRGQKVEYLPLRKWCVPSGWGRVLGGTLALLYVMTLIVPQSTNSMFYVFSGVFEQVFALQGIACACYVLHERGKSRGWQALVFALGYIVLRPAAICLGIADQAMDFTHRRAKMQEAEKLNNPFDPRAQK